MHYFKSEMAVTRDIYCVVFMSGASLEKVISICYSMSVKKNVKQDALVFEH